MSVGGIAIEKQCLALRRTVIRQQYRREILADEYARLRLETQQLGAPIRLIETLEQRRTSIVRGGSQERGDGYADLSRLAAAPSSGSVTVRFSRLENPTYRAVDRRRLAVICVLSLGGMFLTARLVQLQVIEAGRLSERANRQRSYIDVLPAAPGDLLDRDGRVLATTVKSHSLYLDPEGISDLRSAATGLGTALKLDADHLCERLVEQRNKRFVWVKRRLSAAEEEAVVKLKLAPGTWGFRDEYLRRYPAGRPGRACARAP